MDQILLSSIPLQDLKDLFRDILREELQDKAKAELQEKLLSPKEAIKIFKPNISTVTLNSWVKSGFLKRYNIGGRTWFKYSELIESLSTLKKYQTKPL